MKSLRELFLEAFFCSDTSVKVKTGILSISIFRTLKLLINSLNTIAEKLNIPFKGIDKIEFRGVSKNSGRFVK